MYVHWYEPPPPRAVTGGYLYNQRLKAALVALGWELKTLHPTPAEFAVSYRQTNLPNNCDCVIVDSLFLPQAITHPTQQPGLFWMLHSTPSQLKGNGPLTEHQNELAPLKLAAGMIATGWLLNDRFNELNPLLCLPGRDDNWPDKLQTTHSDSDSIKIITVANFTANKGQAQGLSVLNALLDKGTANWSWSIVGAGLPNSQDYYQDFCQKLANSPKLQPKVTVHTDLARPKLADLMSASDLFLSLSRTESFGMAVAEATFMGLPVLGWDVDRVSRIVGLCGRLFSLDDEANLVDFLHSICSEPTLLSELKKQKPPQLLNTWSNQAVAVAEYIQARL